MKKYYSHGKLLLSGEYLVLDGALALALPTRYGQWLRVRKAEAPGLQWRSLLPDGTPWFETLFQPGELKPASPEGAFPGGTRQRLLHLLKTCEDLKPGFLASCRNTTVETQLEFPRQWGLGSSSTLISNLAAWAGVDPYALLQRTLGGSGYDIAAARSDAPIFYQWADGVPRVADAGFQPTFAESLFFVYLNKKQDSRQGISHYRNRHFDRAAALRRISDLTREMAAAKEIDAFRQVLEAHEALVGSILGLTPVKGRLFPDYPGSVKSLGAWGGDFVLATGGKADRAYFVEKGYVVVKSYGEMIL